MSEEDGKVLAYNHLAGSCDCYGDDPCEDCQEFVEAFSIGYARGRADERKRLLGDGKPDGWCAWHPEKDFMLATIAYDSFHARSVLEDQIDAADIPVDEQDGWKIVPVKLVVLDEINEKDETGGE